MITFDSTEATFDSTLWTFSGEPAPIPPQPPVIERAPDQRGRSPGQVQADLVALAPTGWVWPHCAQGPRSPSLFETLFKALAGGISSLEITAEAMMEEIDPRTASLMLPDFERVLGPDPCGRDPLSLSLEQRRQLAHQRWTARGGASIPYFVALAARRGVAITIRENRVSVADELQAGDELVESPEQFVWTVELALLGETVARADEMQAGDLLLDITLSDIECDIRRAKPAHTEVAFRYI